LKTRLIPSSVSHEWGVIEMNRAQATIWIRAALSLAFITGYGFIVTEFIAREVAVSESTERILIFLFGALTTSVVTIVNFWFSSSQGSVEKTEVMAERRPQ